MNLDIAGRRALVCGASRGLGYACATSLAREGVEIIAVSRHQDFLEEAARSILKETGAKVRTISADVTSDEERFNILKLAGPVDILVTNAGGPPSGGLLSHSKEEWERAVNNNMISAIELIRGALEGMSERRFGRIINITSAVLKAPDDILSLSNGARAGLIASVAGLARTVARHNVTINSLLPGPFKTDRLASLLKIQAEAAQITSEQALELKEGQNPSGRVGDPSEFGDLCAYLCSAQAGFITGQSIVIDGGDYRGLF